MSLRVDIWSDIACPWCYVGKRKLEGALALFDHADAVEIRWHAFELDPSAPREVDRSIGYAERLARKYRTSPAQAQMMMDQMTERAAEDGVEMRFDRLRAGNTFDAHRVLAFAARAGHAMQGALKERLLSAYFTDGELMSDHETLVRLAQEVGLEGEEVRAMLAGDEYAEEVRGDEGAAKRLGIGGVPFFVFGEKFGVSGAQPVDTLLHVLTRAWAETETEAVGGTAVSPAGTVCTPDAPDACL